MWQCKGPRLAKAILVKNQTVGLMLTAFPTDSKAMITKSAWCKNRQAVFSGGAGSGQWGKEVLYTDVSRTAGYMDGESEARLLSRSNTSTMKASFRKKRPQCS